MIPIALDPAQVRLLVVGAGEALARRIAVLRAGGARALTVHAPQGIPAGVDVTGLTVVNRMPASGDVDDVHIMFVAGLAASDGQWLSRLGKRHGVLVNVEDVTDLCDFHTMATVRRGDLMFTVSTGGKAPGLARRLRQKLEADYGDEWSEHLSELAATRAQWQADGVDFATLAQRSNDFIDQKGWLA